MGQDRRERWVDIGSRVLAIGYFGMLCVGALRAAYRVAPAVLAGTASDADVRTLIVKATAVAFSGLLVGVYLFRSRPVRKSEGWLPRAVALLNAVALPVAMVLPTALHWVAPTASTRVAVAGLVLVGVGHLASLFALAFLGRSFSILPEARRLVTRGPYAVVRHPLYTAELFALAGIAMQNWSAWAAGVVVVQLVVLVARMRYEERVLEAEFPEYAEYRRRTKRLIPFAW